MTIDLKVLADNRDALLRAEVAAWLHDDFKHTDAHVSRYIQGAPAPSGRQDAHDLIPSIQISLLGQSLSFLEVKNRRGRDFVNGYLNRCHHTAHIEKQDGDASQRYPAYISSPFGYEAKLIPTDLTSDLRNQISWSNLARHPFDGERNTLQEQIRSLFSRVGGDTRRPTNEITLWEWGHTVGALYKAALAGALLGYQPDNPNDLRWRLLSVRFDGLSFFAQGHYIPDLLARQELLADGLDRVRELLEVTYPLGSEVYRDENGSIFVVPDIPHLLQIPDDSTKITLRDLILTAFSQGTVKDNTALQVDGEILPQILLDVHPWWGQDPQRQGNDQIPPVPDHIRPATNATNTEWVLKQWDGHQQEICTACALRPQGPAEKAKGRKICDVCEERRSDRAQEWANSLGTTIWTDEVADKNGRLALVVGWFDLDRWLDGSMVQTLLANATTTQPKSPSFARLRRIWETTRTFWQEVLPTDAKRNLAASLVGQKVGKSGPRLEIIPENRNNLNLGPFHTYELVVNDIHLSVVWDDAHQRFITCDNLDYLAKPEQLGRPVRDALVVQKGTKLTLEEPVGYGAKNKVWGTITIMDVQELPDRYVPAIPILAEPRTFMALVPADKALKVVKAIQEKYEREMGKVRNRLPLTLGVIYFGRRTPLAAALDAGRRMLSRKASPVDGWCVVADVQRQTGPLPPEKQDLARGTQQFQEWFAVQLKHQRSERSLTWYVPAVMGDGQTDDQWYPYVPWVHDRDGKSDPSQATEQRHRYFQAPDLWTRQNVWMVHAGELKEGDLVHFTPSTFDYEFLDTTARRFEIAYNDQGQRCSPSKRNRPYLLDDLERLERVWNELGHLERSQRHQVIATIEATRNAWFGDDPQGQSLADDVFRQFVHDTLAGANWPKGHPWKTIPDVRREDLIVAGVRGELADLFELYTQILKE